MTRSEARSRTGRNYGGMSAEARSEERRQRLKGAALELFGTQGYPATSIEQLCSLAGVSTRSFYEDIGSRESLLIALADDITGRAAAAAFGALAELAEASLPDRVAGAFRAYLDVTCQDHRSARVCYVEVTGVSPAVEEWRNGWRRRISQVLVAEAERAVGRGEARERPFRLLTVIIVGAVNSLAQELALAEIGAADPLTLDDVCEEISSLVITWLERP